METLIEDDSLRQKGVHEKKAIWFSHLQEGVLEFERLGFLASSLDRDLASTRTLSKTITLEVVRFTLRVDTIKGEPRTWFASV